MAIPISNNEVYCYLKTSLEPEFRVQAVPKTAYYSQHEFRYQVFDGQTLCAELTGDFRHLSDGELVRQAEQLLDRLRSAPAHSVAEKMRKRNTQRTQTQIPYASRLPPKQSDTTWFSSGRAAFAFLLKDVLLPNTIYLPTFICWSLIDVLRQRFPQVRIQFYPVDRSLACCYPQNTAPDTALLFVHYFGHANSIPDVSKSSAVIEDCSHRPMNPGSPDDSIRENIFSFGSLRKAYRLANGGYLRGRYCPVYEPDRGMDAWLRLVAEDWRDLREAENMTDRGWSISDISSQALSVVMQAENEVASRQRKINERFLSESLSVGSPVVKFGADESPLLHCRSFETTSERDSLRTYLSAARIFTSIHWPVHPYVFQQGDHVDLDGALWMQNQTLAFPVAEDFNERHLARVCNCAREWKTAGGSRFPQFDRLQSIRNAG